MSLPKFIFQDLENYSSIPIVSNTTETKLTLFQNKYLYQIIEFRTRAKSLPAWREPWNNYIPSDTYASIAALTTYLPRAIKLLDINFKSREAFVNRKTDIHIPSITKFDNPKEFYLTCFHEIAHVVDFQLHSVNCETRFLEFVAEFSAFILLCELDIADTKTLLSSGQYLLQSNDINFQANCRAAIKRASIVVDWILANLT